MLFIIVGIYLFYTVEVWRMFFHALCYLILFVKCFKYIFVNSHGKYLAENHNISPKHNTYCHYKTFSFQNDSRMHFNNNFVFMI